jgi:hypothetical protein
MTIQSLTVTLSGLDSQGLASDGQYNLHASNVELAKALYHPDTRALVTVASVFKGYIDTDTHIETKEGDTIVSALNLTCGSRALELDRATNRKRNDTDQKRYQTGDKGFEWVKRVNTKPIPWGMEREQPGFR